VSLREEHGQVATAHRALARIERFVPPGGILDIGCWTGSFLDAAAQRGWSAVGIEPSQWAAARARTRGLSVRCGTLDEVNFDGERFRAVVACDVLEHLLDPCAAVRSISALLEPGGVLYVTVPNAGSAVARLLGKRWWSVLPMHVQYFTRSSMRELLERNDFVIDDIRTHAKVFTAAYYAERLASFVPRTTRLAAAFSRSAIGRRLIAPDFHDRMAVFARPAVVPSPT
jgi:2-polyprenyl-3-methyl-5-hydroxy-6-metoxy-1,4-benzoquinol methylase